jgi:thioredoxin 1
MSKVTELTDSDFEATTKQSTLPILVDFSATWCGPCKTLAPTIDAVADQYKGRLQVYKVDIDKAHHTAANFGIQGVPTCVFLKNGREVDRFSGVQDLRAVKDRVEKILA